MQNKILNYILSPTAIDQIAEAVITTLADWGVERQIATRLRLSAEEVLLAWLPQGGNCRLKLTNRLGRVKLALELPGGAIDPLAGEDEEREAQDSLVSSFLSQLGQGLKYEYANGVNRVSAVVEKKRHIVRELLLSLGAALAVSLLLGLLPVNARTFIQQQMVQQLFDAFLGLLSAIVGPMMFLAVLWGIYNIGDTARFGRIGRRVLSQMFLAQLLAVLLGLGASLLFFDPSQGGAVAGGESQLGAVIAMVLDIIPGDFLSPFIQGNSLQIIFMAVVVGVAMIILRERVPVMAAFVEQSNAVVQHILSAISRLVPAFIFISVVRFVLSGEYARFTSLLRFIGIASLCLVVILLLYLLSLALIEKVDPWLALRKAAPAGLIALITASSSAAYASSAESCQKRLGVDPKLSNFALPLGTVMFNPDCSAYFLLLTMFAAQSYGVAIPPSGYVVAALNALIVSMAVPPIPGGLYACYTLLFLQMGIPLEAMAVATIADIVIDHLASATTVMSVEFQLIRSAHSLNMLDREMLQRRDS